MTTPTYNLINEVQKVDRQAALMLKKLSLLAKRRKLKTFTAPTVGIRNRPLIEAFMWNSSPQGARYWANIDNKLDEARRNDQV